LDLLTYLRKYIEIIATVRSEILQFDSGVADNPHLLKCDALWPGD